MVAWYLMLRSIRCCSVRTTVPINGRIGSIVSTASKGDTINAKLHYGSPCDMPKYPYIKHHPCVVVETMSDIKAGDEIIIDYGWKDKIMLFAACSLLLSTSLRCFDCKCCKSFEVLFWCTIINFPQAQRCFTIQSKLSRSWFIEVFVETNRAYRVGWFLRLNFKVVSTCSSIFSWFPSKSTSGGT